MKLLKYLLLLFVFNSVLLGQTTEKVSLQLLWKHQFEFAGFYMAKEKGFYKDVGLDVEIKKFNDTISPINEVIQNRATYGIGRSSLIIDKSHGLNIKLLSAIFQSSPSVLLSLESSGIKDIKDFVGKNIMMTSDVFQAVSLQAMIKQKK